MPRVLAYLIRATDRAVIPVIDEELLVALQLALWGLPEAGKLVYTQEVP